MKKIDKIGALTVGNNISENLVGSNEFTGLGVSLAIMSDNCEDNQDKKKLEPKKNELEFKKNIYSKVKSSVLGFAIGDAMGVPVEFYSREKLLKNPVTKMMGYGSHDVPEGCWSDDTSMVLATMDSIIESKGINYNNMADKFCDWINDAKYTSTDELFDIGIATKNALIKYWTEKHPDSRAFGIGRTTLVSMNKYNKNKVDATKCGGMSFNDNGNGSLMRILPVAFYLFYKNIMDENKIYEIVKSTSSITHGHEISIMGCLIYVVYILNLLNGLSKTETYQNLSEFKYSKYFSDETITLYSRILNKEIPNLNIEDISSSGYVLHTLEAVLWVTLNANNFKESIIGAINLGNDTDTIGALVGAISGLIYDFESVPNDWLKDLKRKEYIEQMCINFEAIFVN